MTNIVGNVVQLSSADTRIDVALGHAFNPDTVKRQAEAIRALEEQVAIGRLDRHQRSSEYRAAVLAWMFANVDSIVFDIDGIPPARMITLVENSEFERLGRFIEAALSANAIPRMVCAGCRDVECNGCNGYATVTVLPRKILNLLSEQKQQTAALVSPIATESRAFPALFRVECPETCCARKITGAYDRNGVPFYMPHDARGRGTCSSSWMTVRDMTEAAPC